MTNKVLIKISGLQVEIGNGEAIETIQPGHYRKFLNKHVVSFDECPEGFSDTETIRNIIKISKDSVLISKNGPMASELYFKENEPFISYYRTPFGTMDLNIFTTCLIIDEQEDFLHVHIEYSLDINHEHVSDCTVDITITSQK